MVDIIEAAEHIYMIDARIYSLTGWGSVYLLDEDQKAMVDTGPATSADTVLAGIKKLGMRPGDIEHIIATHVHLDHAGGAGVLVQQMPRARVWVHQKGARNLVDPTRLMSSTIAFQGEEALIKNGEVVPIPADRVKPVYGGEELRLSAKQLLRFIDAPGHAPHELCIHESRNNGLFLGDAVGTYMAENEIVLPVTAPPAFDSELYATTLRRLMELKADRLYFTHFGIALRVQEVLKKGLEEIKAWDEIAAKALSEDSLREKILARISQRLEPLKKNESIYRHAIDMSVNISAVGYMKYQRDKKEAVKRRNSESNQRKD